MQYAAVSKETDTYNSSYIKQGNSTPSDSTKQRDKEIAEYVISAIQRFLEKNCLDSKKDFSFLGTRPLTAKICQNALDLIDLFHDRIEIKQMKVETSHYCHEVSGTKSGEYLTMGPPQKSKLVIVMSAYDAFRRHLEVLRTIENGLEEISLKHDDGDVVEFPSFTANSKYTTHGHMVTRYQNHTTQTKLIPQGQSNNAEASCFDACTLF